MSKTGGTHVTVDQDLYRQCLQTQWDADTRDLLSRGIVPPWDGTNGILDDDDARALTLAADNLGIDWSPNSKSFSRATVKAMGMRKHGNTKYILDKLIERGLLKAKGTKLVLTQVGQWRLDLHENNFDGETMMVEPVDDVEENLGGLFG
jgi:hypothetical protein